MTYEQALAKVNKEKPINKWNFGTNSFSKYHAIKTTYNNHVYDSKLEAKFASQLDLRMKGGDILTWDRQKQIELYFYDSRGNKITYKKYKVDFLIYHKDGTMELAEVKGFETEDWLWKKTILEKVWLKDNPGYIYKVYKAKDI